MFGVKKERIVHEHNRRSFLGIFFSRSYKEEYIDHVAISGNSLNFSAQEIEVHGNITAQKVAMQADHSIKITANKVEGHIKQSIIKADNAFIIAENIEQIGSIFRIKDELKIISHNDVRIIPIEVISNYMEYSSSSGWFVKKA
jgi:hypothetical protein